MEAARGIAGCRRLRARSCAGRASSSRGISLRCQAFALPLAVSVKSRDSAAASPPSNAAKPRRKPSSSGAWLSENACAGLSPRCTVGLAVGDRHVLVVRRFHRARELARAAVFELAVQDQRTLEQAREAHLAERRARRHVALQARDDRLRIRALLSRWRRCARRSWPEQRREQESQRRRRPRSSRSHAS